MTLTTAQDTAEHIVAAFRAWEKLRDTCWGDAEFDGELFSFEYELRDHLIDIPTTVEVAYTRFTITMIEGVRITGNVICHVASHPVLQNQVPGEPWCMFDPGFQDPQDEHDWEDALLWYASLFDL